MKQCSGVLSGIHIDVDSAKLTGQSFPWPRSIIKWGLWRVSRRLQLNKLFKIPQKNFLKSATLTRTTRELQFVSSKQLLQMKPSKESLRKDKKPNKNMQKPKEREWKQQWLHSRGQTMFSLKSALFLRSPKRNWKYLSCKKCKYLIAHSISCTFQLDSFQKLAGWVK